MDIDSVWRGETTARHVLYLAEHLQLNPRSRVYAIRGGNPELQGWGVEAILLARLHNVVVSAVGGKSEAFVKFPGATSERYEQPFQTIAEFSATAFSEFMYGR